MVIIPITLREANEFISLRHRHLGKAVGCKFALGLADEKRGLIGIAVCGRPVSSKRILHRLLLFLYHKNAKS